MIDKYVSKNINDDIITEMYNILINNLFITYPQFLKEREKHDNKEIFNKWKSMLKNTEDYYILTYKYQNRIRGFFNYSIIENNLWISEIQIEDEFKKKGILKMFLEEFAYLDICNNYTDITIHVNDQNLISKEVFTHIGFKPIGNTLYKISISKLREYLSK